MELISKNDIKKINKIISNNSFEIKDLSNTQIKKIINDSDIRPILDSIFDKHIDNVIDKRDVDSLEPDVRKIIINYFDIRNIEVFDEGEILDIENELEQDKDTLVGFSNNQLRDYVLSIKDIPILSHEEVKQLFDKYHNGDIEARNELITHNLKLVVNMAKRYTKDNSLIMDLVNEGNIGLMIAVERFDVEKGYMFSTYATWWIRQSITRYMADKLRNIRVPVHMVESIYKLKYASDKYFKENGVYPTTEELSKLLGLSIEKVNNIIKASQETVSLEQPVGEDEHGEISELIDFIKDNGKTVEDEIYDQELKNLINEMLSTFNDRERKIIQLRFGLTGGNAKTLEEVGKEFKITRERVRQIEAKAMNKLRLSKRQDKLRDFL